MINTQHFLVSLPLLLSLQVLSYPAVAQNLPARNLSQCDRQQEIFSFQVPNYAISHQTGAILNIKVAYRLTPEAISKNDYPDFVPIRKEVSTYLTNYPNNTDYWEIVNKNLVKRLLDRYPQMSSLSIELGVLPAPQEPFARSSIVRSTRPQGCPIMLGS
jgi:hypothetical protein